MSINPQTSTLPLDIPRMNVYKAMFLQLRPKQWAKNVLVFASAIFAGILLESHTFFYAILAFICFSFMASTIYIINDIVDVDKDRLHPDKCKRPIASRSLSVQMAVVLAVILFVCSIGFAMMIKPLFATILLIYFVMNLLYSIKLKHIVIIDVMIIASGFVLRAISGAIAVNGNLTSWFILCTLMLSLFLALGKRRHELQLFDGDLTKQRVVLQFYSVKLLDQMITIVSSLTIMSYCLYAGAENHYMMFTIPFVIYGIFRYMYLVHMEDAGGKPEDVLLNDKYILVTVIIFSISVLFIKSYF